MSKRGVARITGPSRPKIGETAVYSVSEWHSGTPEAQRNGSNIKWELFRKRGNGSFTTTNIIKTGRTGSFTFEEKAYGEEFLVEGYLHSPELSGSTTVKITPLAGEPKILTLTIFDGNKKRITENPKYGQTIYAEVKTQNMLGERLKVQVWERDTYSDSGHDPEGNTLLWEKEITVPQNGINQEPISLTQLMMEKAKGSGMSAWLEGGEHEYYLVVKRNNHTTYSQQTVAVDDKMGSPLPSTQNPTSNNGGTQGANNNPAPAEKAIQEPVRVEGVGADTPENSGKTPNSVEESTTEGLTTAYFAKKVYTVKTGKEIGSIDYQFQFNNNRTATEAQKQTIAETIIEKQIIKDLVKEKQYTTLNAIKEALTKDVYQKDEIIKIKTFELGAEFQKIDSAPLEDKVYLVANGVMLDGKEATIIVKEKDGLLKGSEEAILSFIQITEAQMDSSEPIPEEQRNEKNEFKATFSNGMAKIPVQLRPKKDDELQEWHDKIAKGKEDGTYTYTFNNPNGTNITEQNKAELSGIILNNAKDGKLNNPKIENGKTAYKDDIEAVLEIKTYAQGSTIEFPLYKNIPELLFLQVKAQGEEESYDKEFLKGEGKYFRIGKGNCSCNRDLTESEFKAILKHLRESENLEIETIWNPRNAGGASPTDTSIASTLTKLNQVMKDNDITTCIRKVYFIAECYHETDRFYSTQEYNSRHTAGYDPYRGRGIIQLTHKEAYQRFGHYKGDTSIETNYAQVATNLDLAFESAGWYWKQGKLLSVGNTWSPTEAARTRYNLNARSYPKTTVATNYTNNSGQTVRSYGSVNLNLVADNDDIRVISYLINGGDNGLAEREEYLAELKKISFFICEEKEAGPWRDPVDNPISTNYMQSGGSSHDWGLFSNTIRGRAHTGLDFFAKTGSNIYACVDGTIYNRRWHSGYGNTVTVKVADPKAFLARKRTDYTNKSTQEIEHGNNWSEDGDIYLFYAHLDSVEAFNFGDEVKSGRVLGKTGRSGVTNGTCAPHLHFEIFCSYNFGGTAYRINPAYFVNYKHYDEQSQAERNQQTTESERGKIDEFDGSNKLSANNIF